MSGKFEPKEPVNLNPPKDDPITVEHLSKCNGKIPRASQALTATRVTLLSKQGVVFDVNGKEPYLPGGSYSVFSGHDASRALAKTSTKASDVSPEWFDLDDKEKGVLNDWYTFFSKRYNIVGKVAGATNFDPSL
ncbi:hypothetical protein VE04_04337 [Pseudogymnoascus sp. 24MN13]|uniref:Cytochrome b5 heme-binding domain-containing protein n=1 Tax=Pseudogymnoascus verrucosus TaxID=342668 RepID=A0A1B8G9B1_9PEZI|nr:uncharacterized protein VE01_09255 [Pseudogymnoascus verrucosus]OBT55126.1 hypothetical protein VE04_04337 [Pseudogymnoascus sp. 24MN13]OBT92412.1 hypothetical protein VE01_09255 [Pseudogymnoascus verrucosus]